MDARIEHAEELLRKAEAKFRGLVEWAPYALVIVDTEGRICLVNRQTEQLFGYTREELVGLPVEVLVPERLRNLHRGYRAGYFTNARPRPMGMGLDLYGRCKDGSEFPVDISLGPLEAEEGMLVIAAIRDITERKRAEEELRQAQRLEAVGLLAGGVAHDFNNLLNGIIGFVELALRELPPGSTGHNRLSRVPGLGRQAADLIARLLTFARQAPQERKPLDLNALLKETAEFLRRTLPETLTLRVEPAPEPMVVEADLAQTQQLFLNLATNARDAMPGGGTLSLRLIPVTLTAASVGGGPERRPGDFVCLTVADTGTGIPAAIRDRIFDPFFTTKAPGQGTGLGLASVYGTVHQHQGWIEVETAEGQGTAFQIFLPQLPGPVPVAPAVAETLPRGTETLLVVEDNPMVLELGEIFLTQVGYTVLTARDGTEALEVFRAHSEIALALTDAIMPRMGAEALIPALRALNPRIKILVATGYASAEIRASLDHLPLLGYIQKPFRQAELALAVRTALDGPAPDSR